MLKTSIVLLSCLFSSVAFSATTYNGENGFPNGNDRLTLSRGQATIVANCGARNGGGRVVLSIAKETTNNIILKGSSKVFSMVGGTGHMVVDPIVMRFKRLPNGNLMLYGKGPSMSSLYNDHGASCAFGLSHSEYVNKPYNVVFVLKNKAPIFRTAKRRTYVHN